MSNNDNETLEDVQRQLNEIFDMKAKNIIEGEATLYVDKPLCNYCKKVIFSIEKQYGVKLTIKTPEFLKIVINYLKEKQDDYIERAYQSIEQKNH